MMPLLLLFLLAAFIACVLWAMGKCPGWVSVLLIIVIMLIQMWPK